jgi:hypothetical protein
VKKARENFRVGVSVFKAPTLGMRREEVSRLERQYVLAADAVSAYMKALECGGLEGQEVERERERVFTLYAEAMNGLEGWTGMPCYRFFLKLMLIFRDYRFRCGYDTSHV